MAMRERCAGRFVVVPAPAVTPIMSRILIRSLVLIRSLILALVWGGVFAPAHAAETRELHLRFPRTDVELVPARDGKVEVQYRGALHAAAVPGAPALPAVVVYLEAPAAATAGDFTVEALAVEPLGRHELAAAAPDHPADRAPIPAPALDPALLARGATYPSELATFLGRGALRGRNLLAFRVHPVRFQPGTGELELVTEMRLRCTLAPARSEVLVRRRVAPLAEERFAADLEPVLGRHGRGIEPPATTMLGGGGGDVAGPGPFQPTFRPTTDGSPVEYVIVTSEALKTEFQRLADWKTQKGVQAVVRTVEWIDQTYPNGVDRSERVRFFIRDAYQNWGSLYVLLGGDTDVVPARLGATTMLGGELIPADHYYACLEGNWNADGDTRFGEGFIDAQNPGDKCDLYPEMYVGRAPVTSLAQAGDFVDKTFNYDRHPATGNGYSASILYLAERLFDELDGAEIAEEADDLVPPWFKRVKLYEEYQDWPGALPETYDAVVDSINHGFGIVHHVGHGFRNTMAVGVEVLNNADADALANAPRNSVVFSINCSSASIDFNSIGERWVKNPNGGSIAYIGTSRLAFVSASRELQGEWFATVFQDSVRNLGGACALSRLPFLSLAEEDNGYRWTAFALTLLGDPEVDLATRNLVPLSVAHAASYALGSAAYTATVTSSGVPVSGARVTLWKSGEAYARGTTGPNGVVSLPFAPETPGPALLTVHRSNYAVYTTTVNVLAAPSTHVYADGIAVDDDAIGPSDGDNDDLADAGEAIEFTVTLRNGGTVPLTGVFAVLSDVDPDGHLTLTDNSAMYGTINPGAANSGDPFVIAIAPDAPYAFQPVLNLSIVTNQGTFADAVVLPIRRSYLEHLSHTVDDAPPRGDGDGRVEPGEEIWYRIALRNTGQETGFVVKAGLLVVRASTHLPEPLVAATDTSSTFGTITPGGTVTGDRFVFELGPSVNPASVLLKVAYRDVHGAVRTEFLDLIAPPTPDSLYSFGSPGSILLRWARPPDSDLLGYDIHRSTNLNGPYQKVNAYLGEGSATYEDRGLAPLTRYYYRIVARDSSINASAFSNAFSGSTNPPLATAWPLEVGQQASSSLKIANTAGGNDFELFVGAEYMYGWHGDGSEIVDGDDDARTSGVYAPDGYHVTKGFSATAALGDMDLDGRVEVANVGWTVPNAYIWDDDGDLKPGWPKSLLGDFNWPSPLLVDLNGDDDLELVAFAAKEGRLFAWHHNGTEVVNGDNNPATNGVLIQIPGGNFCYSSPAAGNLDQDADPEIVFCLNISTGQTGPIYAVNRNGTLVSGWPVHTGAAGAPSAITSSPALGDLDKNGTLEVVVASERNGGRVHVLRNNGTNMPGWPKDVPCLTSQVRTSSPVLADIDNDTFLDVVFLTSNGLLYAWTRTGAVIAGFPVNYATGLGEATQSTPAIGDIDDDGRMEIVFGDETGKLHAYNHNGTPVNGFPIQLNGEVRGTPFIWDVDQDGLIEVGVAGWDSNVYIWDLPYAWNPNRIPWPFFRHDAANTGCVTSQILPVGVGDPGPLGAAPRMARVHPVYPNPVRAGGRFAFDVPGSGPVPVTLRIYDVAGRMVAEVLQTELIPGAHVVDWNGRGTGGRALGPGVYFYRTSIGDFTASRKLTVLK
jgi:uncharacterized repeat protein (TIGR01451 family)